MFRLAVLLLLVVWPVVTQAQWRGVVWTPPASTADAAAELRRMHEVGVEAVRTSPIRDRALYRLADSLGMQFFQELELTHLPAPRLLDSLNAARRDLRELLALARRHPSARHFGLARHSDTTTPRVRPYFETLTALVHSELPDAQTYYVSAFREDDAASDAVDFVLLDLLDLERPAEALATWRARHDTPVGVAQLGTWVRDDRGPGYRVPNAPEAQARLVETALWNVLYETQPPPVAVFVYQWKADRDQALALDNPFTRDYGLVRRDGTERPAVEVVSGFFNETQQVFAFPPGDPPGTTPSSMMVLLGWVLVGAVLLLYIASAKFRKLLRRYFQAHSFYREEVRSGRDQPLPMALTMFVVLALAGGVAWTVFLRTVYQTDAFAMLLNWMGDATRGLAVTLLGNGVLSVLLIAAIYAVLWFVQIVVVFFNGRPRRVDVSQAATLVVWPRWPLLVLMFVALVVGSLPASARGEGGLLLLALLVVTGLWAFIRTQLDFVRTFNIPPARGYLIGLGVPIAIATALFLLYLFPNLPEADFLWHLAVRD